MPSQKNLEALQRAVAAFNNVSDRSAYFDLYATDVVLHGFPPGLPPGVEGVRQFFTGFWAAFPDAQLAGDDVIGEDDKLAIRYTIRGSHGGEFLGIQPTGKQVELSGMTILRFSEDARCLERWNVADLLGLLQELNATGVNSEAQSSAVEITR